VLGSTVRSQEVMPSVLAFSKSDPTITSRTNIYFAHTVGSKTVVDSLLKPTSKLWGRFLTPLGWTNGGKTLLLGGEISFPHPLLEDEYTVRGFFRLDSPFYEIDPFHDLPSGHLKELFEINDSSERSLPL